MTPRVLVTGANGFVGRAVVRASARSPHWRVRAAMRRPTPGAGAVDMVAAPDLGRDASWRQALIEVDTVIHAAARVHVMQETSADPLEAFRASNVEGTIALARQAAEAGVGRFVFVSSIKVLGERTAPGECFSPASPCAPEDAYGRSKAEAEDALWAIAADTGMEVVIVRPPLVYGPGVGANLRLLLTAVHRGWPLPVGAIRNQRSLIGVENLADLLLRAAAHPAAPGRAWLVSDGDLSTPELVRVLADGLGRRARLWSVPPACLRWGAAAVGGRDRVARLIESLQVDASDTVRTWGWSPPVPQREGLQQTALAFLAMLARVESGNVR